MTSVKDATVMATTQSNFEFLIFKIQEIWFQRIVFQKNGVRNQAFFAHIIKIPLSYLCFRQKIRMPNARISVKDVSVMATPQSNFEFLIFKILEIWFKKQYSQALRYTAPRCTDPADTQFFLGPKFFQLHGFTNVGHSFTPQLHGYKVGFILKPSYTVFELHGISKYTQTVHLGALLYFKKTMLEIRFFQSYVIRIPLSYLCFRQKIRITVVAPMPNARTSVKDVTVMATPDRPSVFEMTFTTSELDRYSRF